MASAVLRRQDVCVPSSTGEGFVPSHPGTESSLSDEAKNFKASGNGNPSHKADGCWLQTYGKRPTGASSVANRSGQKARDVTSPRT